MKSILISLGITILVSSIIAYFLTHFDIEFLKSFLLITVIQFVGWNVYQNRLSSSIRQQDNVMLGELAKQSIVAPCAYCQTSNFVPVRMDIDNQFDCSECGKTNTVLINIETAQITTPLGSTTINVADNE